MKYFFSIIICSIIVFSSCRTTKQQINKIIAPKDTVVVNLPNNNAEDSLKMLKVALGELNKNRINFKTFNAKIKVDYQDNKGKKPDVTAIVRIFKDSAIWISLTASILNVEIFRALITRDSVVLMNIQQKEVQYRSLDYLQEVTEIPFDFYTLQDLLVGNPVYVDSNIVYYKQADNFVLLSSTGIFFKNLITLSADNYALLHIKLDDVDVARHRTADITYSDYEDKSGMFFSTGRQISVSEKNKLDITLNYKRYEFNKDLSVSFNVPKNYTKK